MTGMTKPKNPASGGNRNPKKVYPSRKKTSYVAVPREYYEALKAMGKEQDRSTSWIGRKAIREFLEKHGRLPKHDPPLPD